jgi:hypothetical protein
MRRVRKIIAAAVAVFVLTPAVAQASLYPSQALANQTLRNYAAGPCGDGTLWRCSGPFEANMECGYKVGNNALRCSGYYEESKPSFTSFYTWRTCQFGYDTRVAKVSEGVAKVLGYSDSCHG